jgi:putative aldouronate transport system permease protein
MSHTITRSTGADYAAPTQLPKASLWRRIYKVRFLYVIFLPVLAYFLVFKYVPMLGILVAFQNFKPFIGFWESQWVGFRQFELLFSSVYFWRLLRNTLMIRLYDIVFVFPAPIILALLLNELSKERFKRLIQTISYLPHFISTVIVASMVVTLLSPSTGLLAGVIEAVTGERVQLLTRAPAFWPIYTLTNAWKSVGWGSIIYLAALTGIDLQLYEAATIDGAGYLRKALSITLPGLVPTIVTLLLLRIGNFLEVGRQMILLLYNPATYETADVLSTFTYRRGLISGDYSYAAAVGLFESAVGVVLILGANFIANRLSNKEQGLW